MKDEHKMAKEFNRDLERVLRGTDLPPNFPQEVTPEYLELLRLAKQFQGTDFTSDNSFRNQLRGKLLSQDFQAPLAGIHRSVGLRGYQKGLIFSLVGLVIIVIGFTTVPPLKSFAQGIFEKIGIFQITSSETPAERVVKTTPGGSTPLTGLVVVQSIEEASQVAGFKVVTPGYIPTEYKLTGMSIYKGRVNQAGSVILPDALFSYQTDPHSACLTSNYLFITQTKPEPGVNLEMPISTAKTTQITVRGQPGLWIENAPTGFKDDGACKGSTAKMIVVNENILVWEESGFTFRLNSNILTLDELLKIAEGIIL